MGKTSIYRNVLFLVKYRCKMLKSVLLNRSTIEHFTIGSWEVKYFTCLLRNQSCSTFPLHSIPLSVLRENGSCSSKVLNALTTSTGDFDFIGTKCAFFEKRSTRQQKIEIVVMFREFRHINQICLWLVSGPTSDDSTPFIFLARWPVKCVRLLRTEPRLSLFQWPTTRFR